MQKQALSCHLLFGTWSAHHLPFSGASRSLSLSPHHSRRPGLNWCFAVEVQVLVRPNAVGAVEQVRRSVLTYAEEGLFGI